MGEYDIVLADPPWPYYGSTTKDAAAGKHYDLMDIDDIKAIPVRSLVGDSAAVFLWATGPRCDLAIDTLRDWGFHFRGVAFVWVKTRKDGVIIHGQGVPPTATKPTTEFVLFGTLNKRGRPFPLEDAAVPQVVLAPRGAHSEKPAEIHDLIHRLYGQRPSVELFARRRRDGWDALGLESDGTDLTLI